MLRASLVMNLCEMEAHNCSHYQTFYGPYYYSFWFKETN